MDIWIVVKKDKLLGKEEFPREEVGQNWEKDKRLSGPQQREVVIFYGSFA